MEYNEEEFHDRGGEILISDTVRQRDLWMWCMYGENEYLTYCDIA